MNGMLSETGRSMLRHHHLGPPLVSSQHPPTHGVGMMRAPLRIVSLLLLTSLLAACGGRGEVKRIYPPQATMQQLTLGPNGQWQLHLRVENFSTVTMRLDATDLKFTVAGVDAGSIKLTPQLTVSPNSAEVLTVTLAPPAEVRAAAAVAQSDRTGLRYQLAGTLEIGEPKGRYDIEYESVLSPVPGLQGVFR